MSFGGEACIRIGLINLFTMYRTITVVGIGLCRISVSCTASGEQCAGFATLPVLILFSGSHGSSVKIPGFGLFSTWKIPANPGPATGCEGAVSGIPVLIRRERYQISSHSCFRSEFLTLRFFFVSHKPDIQKKQ